MSTRVAVAIVPIALSLIACGGDPAPAGAPVDFAGQGGAGGGTTADGGGPQATTETLQGTLSEFGQCMSVEAFVRTGIYKLHKGITKDNQQCGSCHANGEGGAFISEDLEAMFDHNASFPGVMRLVTGTVDERGNFVTLVPSNRYIEKGVEPCLEGDACHPRFNLSADLQQSVVDFVEDALERWKNKSCGAGYQAPEGT